MAVMRDHWESVYARNPPDRVSWFRPHLESSLALIQEAALAPSAAIVDIGGGASTLVDDLLARGYQNLAVLDIAQPAIDHVRRRLGAAATRVHWIQGDVLTVTLAPAAYDLWHDRALFHFLTAPEDRAAYILQLTRSLRPGAHIVLSTFSLEGPPRCSGLPVVRYDAASLARELGPRFQLVCSSSEIHETPSGNQQHFLLCHFRNL